MMRRFSFTDLPLPGLKLLQRERDFDNRGHFSRLFCAQELAAVGWNKPIAQINHSYTASRGTVRGLHFQCSPHAEMKLVSCLQGSIWDVVVDVRKGSPTFLCWHAEVLSKKENNALLIPEGFAHGFQTLSDEVELVYCHSEFYTVEAEFGLNIMDPRLSINWPLPLGESSLRDAKFPYIDESDFEGAKL